MKLRELVISELGDRIMIVLEDIETSRDNVTDKAKEHINDNDLILTYSTSETLVTFFLEARKTVRFELIVLETAPTFEGHKTAKLLAEAGIQTNLVQDCSVFAVMSRVDKVIISAHGIMANGGIIGHTGALMIAHAAKAHQVPIFAVGAIYKLTPLHPIDSLTYNEYLQPEKIFRLEDDDKIENIEVVVPAYDYVPPKMVSLILTNQEGYTPENIYRAFHELYGK